MKSLLQEATEEAARKRAEHLEMFAAAYLKMTDIPPDQAELVEERRGNQIVWYFRRRTPKIEQDDYDRMRWES